MIKDVLKWVVPGLATVLGGTTLCLAMTSSNITTDLAAKTAQALEQGGFDWAELSLIARNATLSGTTTDQASLQAARSRLEAIAGLGHIATNVTLAPLASPYRLTTVIDANGQTLSGSIPDDATRLRLLQKPGIKPGMLQLNAGMPDRHTWLSGADFTVATAKFLDSGEVTLADLTIAISGRAKSERDYRDLLLALEAGPPSGTKLGEISVIPPMVSPYQWSATFDGQRIVISGFVPDDATANRLRMADLSGIPVSTGLTLASGEPSNFAALSQTLVEQLSRLDRGTASIDGDKSTLTGAPPTLEVAQAVVDTLKSSGSIVVLEPPRIDDYWVSATRQPGGAVIFDGYAPDDATRQKLAQHAGADTRWLKLGRGSPDRYQSGVDFGLSILDRLGEGRFTLRDNVLTLSGTARSSADYASLLATLNDGAPQGLILSSPDIQAPKVPQYSWTITKNADGAVHLTGFVPSPDVETQLLAKVIGATSSLTYASGEPVNFASSARKAVDLLPRLREGSVTFDGTGWTLTGTAQTPADKTALDDAFTRQHLAAEGWSMAVAAPATTQPAVMPPPVAAEVQPYLWSATKAADSAITVTGAVPTAALQRVMALRAGQKLEDLTIIEPNPPQGFVTDVLAALDALKGLDQGRAEFDGTRWMIEGALADADAAATINAAIAKAATPAASWTLTLSPPAEPQPVAAPVPVVEPTSEPTPDPTPTPATQPVAPPAELEACAAPLAQFSERNAIFFKSGAAALAPESTAALDELAIDLAACPSATVHIEGHTDADGDEAQNMALSVARAEAVVAALVQRGVAAGRLYAVGYGETMPIADNATPEGKRINRRIVVTVKSGD